MTNKSSQPLVGKIVLSVGNSSKDQRFEAAPGKTTKVSITHDKSLNCQAALGVLKVEVFAGTSDLLGSKNLTPKSFTAEKFFPQPVAPTPWVRRMGYQGTCGQPAQGQADVYLIGGAAQNIQADSNFGGLPQLKPYTVAPNAPAKLTAASAAVDCQGATGLPTYRAFLGNLSSEVAASSVTFGG